MEESPSLTVVKRDDDHSMADLEEIGEGHDVNAEQGDLVVKEEVILDGGDESQEPQAEVSKAAETDAEVDEKMSEIEGIDGNLKEVEAGNVESGADENAPSPPALQEQGLVRRIIAVRDDSLRGRVRALTYLAPTDVSAVGQPKVRIRRSARTDTLARRLKAGKAVANPIGPEETNAPHSPSIDAAQDPQSSSQADEEAEISTNEDPLGRLGEETAEKPRCRTILPKPASTVQVQRKKADVKSAEAIRRERALLAAEKMKWAEEEPRYRVEENPAGEPRYTKRPNKRMTRSGFVVRTCAIPWCRPPYSKGEFFFSFPFRDRKLLKEWAKVCQLSVEKLEQCREKSRPMVCHKHFKEEDTERDLRSELLYKRKKFRLLPHAVPCGKPLEQSPAEIARKERAAKRERQLLVQELLKKAEEKDASKRAEEERIEQAKQKEVSVQASRLAAPSSLPPTEPKSAPSPQSSASTAASTAPAPPPTISRPPTASAPPNPATAVSHPNTSNPTPVQGSSRVLMVNGQALLPSTQVVMMDGHAVVPPTRQLVVDGQAFLLKGAPAYSMQTGTTQQSAPTAPVTIVPTFNPPPPGSTRTPVESNSSEITFRQPVPKRTKDTQTHLKADSIDKDNMSLRKRNRFLAKQNSNLRSRIQQLKQKCKNPELMSEATKLVVARDVVAKRTPWSDAQLNSFLGQKRVVWSHSDYELAALIRSMVNDRAYKFLQRRLQVPLPSLTTLRLFCQKNPKLAYSRERGSWKFLVDAEGYEKQPKDEDEDENGVVEDIREEDMVDEGHEVEESSSSGEEDEDDAIGDDVVDQDGVVHVINEAKLAEQEQSQGLEQIVLEVE